MPPVPRFAGSDLSLPSAERDQLAQEYEMLSIHPDRRYTDVVLALQTAEDDAGSDANSARRRALGSRSETRDPHDCT